jgi:hypothetical protein
MASQNIFAALAQPVRSVADYQADYDSQDLRKLQLVGAQRQNELAALTQRQQMEASQQNALERAARLKAAQDAGGDESAYARSLRLSGFPGNLDAADKVDRAIGERQKAASELGKTKSENAKRDTETENAVVMQWRDMIGNSVNPQQAAQMVAAMHSDPRIANTPIARVPLEQGLQMLQQTPFDQWKQQFALGAQKFVEMNKPQYITQNLGGSSRITAVPGLGAGPAVTATEAPVTQDANSIASNATQRRGQDIDASTAAAGRAQSASQFGQRLAYDREKDAATAAGGGNITEGERNAGGYAARMVEASKLLDQFEGKGRGTYKTEALGGVPLVGRSLQTSAMSADQQQYRQAQEDWVRAKLRKESGASIGKDEMDKEVLAYFPEPGDRPENIAQKKQARDVANRAMVQSAGRGAPKAAAAPAPGAVLKFDAQGNPVK